MRSNRAKIEIELPNWAAQFLKKVLGQRVSDVDLVLLNLKKTNPKIHDLVTSSEFQLVGLCPNIIYLKTKGDDNQYPWSHPFGAKTLLYAYKKGQCAILVGPMMRFNDSIVNQLPENTEKSDVMGFTG